MPDRLQSFYFLSIIFIVVVNNKLPVSESGIKLSEMEIHIVIILLFCEFPSQIIIYLTQTNNFLITTDKSSHLYSERE